MVLVVTVLVFLHVTVTQVKAEGIQCPDVCQCPNTTVAICKDLQIYGINSERDKFENSLEKLDFSGNKLRSLNDSTLPTWNIYYLHCFNLSGNNIVNITRLAFSGFSQLEDLDLSRNNLSWIDSEAFEHSPELTVLRLAGNRLTEIHPHIFFSLSHLRYLDLSNNCISAIDPETFLTNGDLEWLSLANNRLTEIDPFIFHNQSKLSYLDLSGNIITKIEGAIFYSNRKLKTLLFASNKISEFNGAAFYEENELSYVDVSRNRIEKLESLKFFMLKFLNISKNSLQTLRARSFSNLKKLQILSLAGNNIVEINDEAFYGLENLEQLDLSSNNITYINLSALPRTEINESERLCVSKIKHLNLSNNRIHSVKFGECHPCNTTCSISILFREMDLLDLRENCLSFSDDSLVNLLNTSGDLINVTNNPCPYECSSSQDIYKIANVTSLHCVSEGDLRIEKCNISKHKDCSTTVKPVLQTDDKEWDVENKNESTTFLPANDENKKETKPSVPANDENKKEIKPSVPANVLIFGIYASSVFVSVIVVLVITHIVGKPEPDEFWWEDKLAKRNY